MPEDFLRILEEVEDAADRVSEGRDIDLVEVAGSRLRAGAPLKGWQADALRDLRDRLRGASPEVG